MKSQLSILPEEDSVRKLIDYILLNAYSVNSTGLHNGKAGIALVLFEAAKHFQDNYIEEQAIELLKESLLSKNENIGFEEGLSGIGYVLLYLIKNKFVEADFDKLFGKNLNRTIDTLTVWKDKRKTEQLFRNQNIVLFLDSIPDGNKSLVRFIELFSDTAKSVISDQIIRSSQLTSSISKTNITMVHNGINDYAGTYRKQNAEKAPPRIQCLFVVNMSKSKGLDFVFKALWIMKRKGYEVELNVTILGALPFDRLIEFYKSSDIGLIASLQEQWSLAAVEMSMFGLPVVTTAVDGLDELFTDNVDALKIGTLFSNTAGLSVNVEQMAEKIIRLIEHKELRMQLSKNVRCMYEKELSLQRMMQQIVSVYQKTIGEI